jgi:hypothetical protein
MSTSTSVNRRILFARWPVGAPLPEDFKTVREPMPTANPGQVLLRTLYLSLDPYMRGRMTPGPSYVEPMALGDTMCGQTPNRSMPEGHRCVFGRRRRRPSSSGSRFRFCMYLRFGHGLHRSAELLLRAASIEACQQCSMIGSIEECGKACRNFLESTTNVFTMRNSPAFHPSA